MRRFVCVCDTCAVQLIRRQAVAFEYAADTPSELCIGSIFAHDPSMFFSPATNRRRLHESNAQRSVRIQTCLASEPDHV